MTITQQIILNGSTSKLVTSKNMLHTSLI